MQQLGAAVLSSFYGHQLKNRQGCRGWVRF